MKNFKSLLSIVLAVMMVASMIVLPVSAEAPDVWDGTADTAWYNDTAAEFTLTTAEQLAGLAQLVNSGNTFAGKTIKLGADIQLQSDADMAGYADWDAENAPANVWTPIGYYASDTLNFKFAGTFDGQGHTISGMYICDVDASVVGGRPALFGYIGGATFENFTLTKSYSNGSKCTGAVAAFHSGSAPSFTNVAVTESTVVGTNDGNGFLVGKMGGFNTFDIVDCYVQGKLVCSYGAGGLVGYLSGESMNEINIVNCSSDVVIEKSYKDDRGAGGLIGVLGFVKSPAVSTLNNLTITGGSFITNATGERDIGGLIGTVILKTLGTATFENNNVEANIDVHAGTANIADVASCVAYLRVTDLTGEVLFKDMVVEGELKIGQNAGVLIGRINAYGAFTKLNSIRVENVETDVDFILKKGTANASCAGAVIGLSENVIDNLIVSGFNTTNTYTPYDSTTAVSSIGGLFASIKAQNISITDTLVKGEIVATGGAAAGLCAAQNLAKGKIYVENTFVTADITGGAKDKNNLGGMFGYVYSTDIDIVRSGVTGTLTYNDLSGARNFGGFIGDIVEIADVVFDACYFTGKMVTGDTNKPYHVAIFVGDYDPNGGKNAANKGDFSGAITVKNCYADADLDGSYNVGGIVGRSVPHNITITVEDSIVLGSRTATSADYTTRVGALVAYYDNDNTKTGIIDINNLYHDSGLELGNFRNGSLNVFVNNNVYTPETEAAFVEVLEASEGWGLGSDDVWYPVGLNYPGHECVYGEWMPNEDDGGETEIRYCIALGCGSFETQEVTTPDDEETCTCKNPDWTVWRVYKVMVCAPGREEEGRSYRVCNKCGIREEKVIPVEHLWSAWNTSCTLGTYNDTVYATRECAGCHHVETSATPVSATHANTFWTTGGETNSLICSDCNNVLATREGVVVGGNDVVVTPTYTDVAGHKYEDDIKFVTEIGLFNGMGNGKFEPETTMTRGMIVTVFARLANVNVTAYKNTFTDVADDSYYAPYVGWAEAAKITNGFGDGTFRADEEITKEQAIAMVVRYLAYVGNEDKTSSNNSSFTDLDTGSEWAKEAVAELIRLGIVENDAATLRPADDATRAELANYFANLVKYLD